MKFVPKGWGFERWIVNNDLYCGKLLFFAKGKRCSFHYHKKKTETFYVQSGRIMMLYSFGNIESLENKKDDIEKCIKLAEEKVEGQRANEAIYMLFHNIYIKFLEAGDSFQINPELVHQAIAIMDSTVFEFSTHHEDEDSYRIVKGD